MSIFRKYYFPIVDKSDNAILRWLSRVTKTKNLHGNRLITLRSDSLYQKRSLTAPIGYIENGLETYFESNNSETEHWYQIDFLSFHVGVTGYTLRMRVDHYHPEWWLLGSQDNIEWKIIDHQTMQAIPQINYNTFTLKQSVEYRSYRLKVNSNCFNETLGWQLLLGSIEFFGYITYFSPNTCQRLFYFHGAPLFFTHLLLTTKE